MDKYISQADVDKETAKNPSFTTEKITLSNDAYAICEFIDDLMKQVRRLK